MVIDTDLRNDVRSTFETQGLVAAVDQFFQKVNADIASGKQADLHYLDTVGKNVSIATGGTKYYSASQGKILDLGLPEGKTVDDFSPQQLEAMNFNKEQRLAIANYEYIKEGSFQQKINKSFCRRVYDS
ncbi:hypothetical protein ACFPDQ_08470 [Pseudofrancisella aestuarii]|uniref:Uncharacterized protein n=1 Tax=Pseudofrancisella aestuarii TaxID=2670347 RepID=A0ABV9TE77_9GAMM|nr:hypothetical protein [Pseudofrancisella aestuarii]